MDNLNILTTQNVLLNHKTANVGERIIATFIDFFILTTYFYVVRYIFSFSNNLENSASMIYIFLIPAAIYHPLSEIFMNGQSLGKKAIGLKVVRIDGAQPSVGSYIIRWIFRLIDVDLFSGIIAIIVISANGKGQRIGDIIAKTTVINTRKKESLENTIHRNLNGDYSLNYANVDVLTDTDINTIKDIILLYKKDMSSKTSSDLIIKTAKVVAKKIDIEYKKSPYEFLQTILSDYNYIHQNSSFF